MLRNIIIFIWREKNTGLVKWSKIITQQLKATENPNIVGIKSVIIEHPKTSHKLSKTIRQAGKVSQVGSGKSGSPLHSETNKLNIFWKKKNVKITKRPHAFKVYASSYYNVDILNSFNPELQLKNTESATKNKLIELLSELKGFKSVTILVLEFKKILTNDKTKVCIRYQPPPPSHHHHHHHHKSRIY